jgi:hypothetical protein
VLPELADDEALVGLDRSLAASEHHSHAGHDQERAEQPHHPFEAQQQGPERDEDCAEHERAQDPEEQHPVLVGGGHGEVAEDHHEHEYVVDRERVLDHVAGQELERGLQRRLVGIEARDRHEPRVLREAPAHEEVEAEVEEQRQRDPDDAPAGGLADRHRVGLAVEDAQVEREQHQHEQQEAGVERPVLGEREEALG